MRTEYSTIIRKKLTYVQYSVLRLYSHTSVLYIRIYFTRCVADERVYTYRNVSHDLRRLLSVEEDVRFRVVSWLGNSSG